MLDTVFDGTQVIEVDRISRVQSERDLRIQVPTRARRTIQRCMLKKTRVHAENKVASDTQTNLPASPKCSGLKVPDQVTRMAMIHGAVGYVHRSTGLAGRLLVSRVEFLTLSDRQAERVSDR